MDFGILYLRINELLEEKGISKNQICKICYYLDVDIDALIEYQRPMK